MHRQPLLDNTKIGRKYSNKCVNFLFCISSTILLKTTFPGAQMYYLMGGDSLHDLPTWNRPQVFVSTCDGIGVMRRHADQVDLEKLEKELPGVSAKVRVVEAPILEISSHQIRQRIFEGQAYRYYLRGAVYRAISDLNMYQEREE